jgi:hypothetical protein
MGLRVRAGVVMSAQRKKLEALVTFTEAVLRAVRGVQVSRLVFEDLTPTDKLLVRAGGREFIVDFRERA